MMKNVKINSNKHTKNDSVNCKNEITSEVGGDKISFNNCYIEKTSRKKNVEDFPELRLSNFHSKLNPNVKDKSSKVEYSKSWLSIVDSNKNKNFDNAFPLLTKMKGPKENRDRVNMPNKFVSEALNETIPVETITKKENQEPDCGKLKLKKVQTELNNSVPQSMRNPKKKKRTDPVLINLDEVLKVNKNKKRIKSHNIVKNKFHKFRDRDILSGNILDSSNPVRNRGKHREIKKKKLTWLKLAIVKERIIKQKIKEEGEEIMAENYDEKLVALINKIDFKAEIKQYLSELQKKKIKEKENKKLKDDTKKEVKKEVLSEKKNENLDNLAKPLNERIESPTNLINEIKFSSKLREYCDNIITPNLNSAVSELIKEIVSLQDKLYARDPFKAQAKKRHVSGFREVKKYLIMKKVKLIIFAPNLEKLQMKGSIYDLINELKVLANNQNVPYVFALNRYKLGWCTKKKVPVSAFAIINYEGATNLFQDALEQIKDVKEQFAILSKKDINSTEINTEKTDVTSEVISSFIAAFTKDLSISKKLENSNESEMKLS